MSYESSPVIPDIYHITFMHICDTDAAACNPFKTHVLYLNICKSSSFPTKQVHQKKLNFKITSWGGRKMTNNQEDSIKSQNVGSSAFTVTSKFKSGLFLLIIIIS
jgi:hypothetical protein